MSGTYTETNNSIMRNFLIISLEKNKQFDYSGKEEITHF